MSIDYEKARQLAERIINDAANGDDYPEAYVARAYLAGVMGQVPEGWFLQSLVTTFMGGYIATLRKQGNEGATASGVGLTPEAAIDDAVRKVKP